MKMITMIIQCFDGEHGGRKYSFSTIKCFSACFACFKVAKHYINKKNYLKAPEWNEIPWMRLLKSFHAV